MFYKIQSHARSCADTLSASTHAFTRLTRSLQALLLEAQHLLSSTPKQNTDALNALNDKLMQQGVLVLLNLA